MTKYVFGHKKPDTDTIVSAILYANYLNSKDVKAEAVILGEINNETKFVLEKFKTKSPKVVETLPENSEVVLVDHNEEKQTISNISELIIDEIIDHHKFNLQTSAPLNIRAEKLGSTCSVLFKIFKENNYKLSKEEAGILVSGIISDTLYFRSPTSTEEDKKILEEVNKIAKIEDLEKYSLEMFKAKSDLGDLDIEKIIKMDYKEFEFAGEKYGVGVIETTNPEYILKRKDEMLMALEKIKKDEELKGILVSIIDILEEHNKTIAVGEHEAEIVRAVFGGEEVEHKIYSLGNIISRKKQIIPKLEEHFNKN